MAFLRAVACATSLQHAMAHFAGVANWVGEFEQELYEGFVMGLRDFDHDNDGILTRDEVAMGILIEDEPREKWMGPSDYPLGRANCDDPYPDSVSLNECLIAEAREGSVQRAPFQATPNEIIEWFASLCDAPSWHSQECLDKCSGCSGLAQSDNFAEDRRLLSNLSTGVDILITSDWHIEPWYKYNQHGHMVSRFSSPSTSNMFQCEVDGHHPVACKVNGASDPPKEFGVSHLVSSVVGTTEVLFFVGDMQAHSWTGFSGGVATGVQKLQDEMIKELKKKYDAESIVYAMGNNDGPHYAIFKKQDSETVAFANSLISNSIVTNDLGITYSGSSQIDMFKRTGFYCKALPRIGSNAYAVVHNTILGGSNAVQQKALDETMQWIWNKHGSDAIVYILGHQPSIVHHGTGFVNSKYKNIVKGVFAGHVHKSASTTSELFTQVPGITQASGAYDGAFYIAKGVSQQTPQIVMTEGHDLCSYRDKRGKHIDDSQWVCGSTPSPSPPPSMPDRLERGETLHAGKHLVSPNGNVRLEMQATDGDLAMYNGGTAVWSAGSKGHPGAHLVFQGSDGNLVLYDGKTALWATGNQASADRVLLTDDCNFVTEDETGNKLWELGTNCGTVPPVPVPPSPPPPSPPSPPPAPSPPGADRLIRGESLEAGRHLVSANGNVRFEMQAGDGNMVLYDGSSSRWSSHTGGHTGAHLKFQSSDGNLVLYDGSKAIWASGNQPSADRVVLQNDCNLVIKDSSGKSLWGTESSCKTQVVAV